MIKTWLVTEITADGFATALNAALENIQHELKKKITSIQFSSSSAPTRDGDWETEWSALILYKD